MSITRILAAVSVATTLLSAPALAQQPARQPPSPPKLDVTEIPDDATAKFVAKSNAVVGLLNTSLRGSESWRRYLSWVDVKRGPTGRERIIYGLYSVSASSAKDAIAKARQLADTEPSIPQLDTATKELASTFEVLVPILNEAEAYYDRKDYMDDKMAGGKELHAKLVPAALAFLAARERAETLQEQLKELMDRQELARLEKTEGKSLKWHTRRVMMTTKKAVDLMPRDPRRPGDLKPFDTAITELAAATREFDTAVRESGKSGSVDSQPRDILGSLREIREKVSKGRADPRFYSMDYNMVVNRYNMMISMSNAFR
jgi:hypothetical protein